MKRFVQDLGAVRRPSLQEKILDLRSFEEVPSSAGS